MGDKHDSRKNIKPRYSRRFSHNHQKENKSRREKDQRLFSDLDRRNREPDKKDDTQDEQR